LTGFVHLHVASWYSLRYGTASPAALAEAAAERGMAGLALTDRDGLYGAFKHAQACAAAGIAPVLGANLGHAKGESVTVLAQGKRGWASLCRLLSAGPAPLALGAALFTPGSAQPAPGPGLIVLVGPDSDVGQAVAARRHDHALAALNRWRERAETVIEVTDHCGPGDTRRAHAMLRFARETRTPVVLTNAVRYIDSGTSPVAQVLDAVRRNVPLGTPGLPVHNGHAYLASPAEMHAVAVRVAGHSDAENLIADTGKLARRCFLDPVRDIGIGSRHLPGTKGDLRHITERALATYRGDKDLARCRLDHELDIIARTELVPYFLTVADVTRRIKDRGIRVAIRGSGAGCLVNHLLGISAIDPLEHGLLMERFLSQTRETMPDIDLDVESARRIEAYRIILDAYGDGACATVAMMETYRARSAIRDVAAAFGLPPGEIDAIAKAFPHIRAAHIGAALAELPELRDTNLTIPQLTAVFRLAERLDGLPRHVAMHPCGVLLSDQTLRDRTPVTRSSVDDLPLSQLDKDDAEIAGVIKLDVLGVRMQSAMAYALTRLPEAVDLDGIPHDDEPTFEMIRQARTIGCFQIESPGQRELVTKVAPRTIGDLIAEISLFRPGPVNSDMITPYLQVRHRRRPASYPHEDLYGALRETGGVVIFHEQVMAVIDTMTGCGLAEADRIRRRLPEGEDAFRAAALGRGYDEPTARRVWEVLAAFGSFGFCKAHAAACALPVYQSAWLKRHHPAAFYAGVLTHDPGMYPKRVIVQDARLAGVQILSPDVSASNAAWITTNGGASPGLRVSLREVKGISDAEVTRIVAGQPYRSLRDFWERARVSRPVTERLISVGAFSSLYSGGTTPLGPPTRRDLLARLAILDRPARPDASMFDLPGDGFADLVPAGQLRELDQAERIAAELDILGFELDGHVLDRYAVLLGELGVVRSDYLRRCQSGSEVLVAGVKVSIQTPAVKSGQRIVFASLDDAVGLVDLAFFESVQDRCAAALFGCWLLLVRGRVRRIGDGAATVSALDCWDLTEVARTGIPAGADRAATRTKIRPLEYPNGFILSPYAETGAPGTPLKASRHRSSRE
jgi:error-prone DNA polymerase